VQDGGCGVLPVSTEICGDGNGGYSLKACDECLLISDARNCSTFAVVVVTSSHDTPGWCEEWILGIVLRFMAFGSCMESIRRIWSFVGSQLTK